MESTVEYFKNGSGKSKYHNQDTRTNAFLHLLPVSDRRAFSQEGLPENCLPRMKMMMILTTAPEGNNMGT